MQGNLGDPRPFTARNISTLDSTTWSTQVSEYPQGVLEYLVSTHRVLKYSSIKLKLRY